MSVRLHMAMRWTAAISILLMVVVSAVSVLPDKHETKIRWDIGEDED